MEMVRLIKTEEDYENALLRIENLFDAMPGTEAGDELELLSTLVELYEKEKFVIEYPDPVSAIKFRMEQQNLKYKDMVPYFGSKSKVSEVLSGKRALSLSMIRKLNSELGIPAEVLINDGSRKLLDESKAGLVHHFPFTDMYNRGWFDDFFSGTFAEAKQLKEELIGNFIGTNDIQHYGFCFNRKGKSTERTVEEALIAWRIRVMNVAAKEILPKWDSEKMDDEFFSQLLHLSYFDKGPLLAKEYMNKIGIHLVIEKHLDKTYLDGASMLMPDGSPLVSMTLRYDRQDSFWFTLFHELAHVKNDLSGSDPKAFFDDITESMGEGIEKAADDFAKEKLLSDPTWKAAALSIDSRPSEIVEFSERNRINTAIPAGRLRFESGNYRVFSNLVGNGTVRKLFDQSLSK